MKEVLTQIFSEENVYEDVIPERGMQVIFFGENEEGGIAAYPTENDDGEPVVHLENIASYRSGHGTELMKKFASLCREEGYVAIEAVVFPLYDSPRWWQYQRLLRWYEYLGFEYAEPEDEDAARQIMNRPGEEEVDGEIRHPRMKLSL